MLEIPTGRSFICLSVYINERSKAWLTASIQMLQLQMFPFKELLQDPALSLYSHAVYIFPLSMLHWYCGPVVYSVEAPMILEVDWGLVCCSLTSSISSGNCCTTRCPGCSASSTRCTKEDHCGYDLPWATHRLVPFGL